MNCETNAFRPIEMYFMIYAESGHKVDIIWSNRLKLTSSITLLLLNCSIVNLNLDIRDMLLTGKWQLFFPWCFRDLSRRIKLLISAFLRNCYTSIDPILVELTELLFQTQLLGRWSYNGAPILAGIIHENCLHYWWQGQFRWHLKIYY